MSFELSSGISWGVGHDWQLNN